MPLHNLGLVGPRVFRCAQPGALDVACLRALGITHLVKLNTPEESPEAILSGLTVLCAPLHLRAPDDDWTRRLVAHIAAQVAAGETVLVHCTHGRDRTGFACAAYQLLALGQPLAYCLEERARFGVDNPWAAIANQSFTHALERLADAQAALVSPP